MLGKIIADTFINPFQSPVFGNPKDYGLEFEDVTFQAQDGVTLSGWLIKGRKDRVIIQSHFGVQCSRSGYTREGKGMIKGWDTDVSFLRQAKYLNEAGYTVLMYDFRNHGKSESGKIPWITWGPTEALDVVAAVDYISKHPDYHSAVIGLLSICMGQGASISAFAMDEGLKNYPNIKTMISVQPMDYQCFVHAMGLPGFLIRSTTKSIKKRTNMDFNESSWRPFVKEVTVPTLIIQNRNDAYLDEDFVTGVYNDLSVEKNILWIEVKKQRGALKNRMAAYDWIGTNPEPILDWFGKYMS